MIRANISDLKNRLSYYLRLVKGGEVIEIIERRTPLARIEGVSDVQPGKGTPGWLTRVHDLGIVVLPRRKKVESDFSRIESVVSSGRKHTGALEALIEERVSGR
jgi:antitoxin (DNA-binding transcriptional repressor) of toxin-antitoxin stability system